LNWRALLAFYSYTHLPVSRAGAVILITYRAEGAPRMLNSPVGNERILEGDSHLDRDRHAGGGGGAPDDSLEADPEGERKGAIARR